MLSRRFQNWRKPFKISQNLVTLAGQWVFTSGPFHSFKREQLIHFKGEDVHELTDKWAGRSVTRLGDLFHFGQLFKASGNNFIARIAHIFCKCVKIFHFSSEIILGTFYRHLATFYRSRLWGGAGLKLGRCKTIKITLGTNLKCSIWTSLLQLGNWWCFEIPNAEK